MARREVVLAAKQPFYAEVNGEQVVILQGQRVRNSHPVVKGREELFEPVLEVDLAEERQ